MKALPLKADRYRRSAWLLTSSLLVAGQLAGCSTARKVVSVLRPHSISTEHVAALETNATDTASADPSADEVKKSPGAPQRSLELKSIAEQAVAKTASSQTELTAPDVTEDTSDILQVAANSEMAPAPAAKPTAAADSIEPPLLPEPQVEELPVATAIPARSSLSLASLESLALDNNPTIKQLAASAGKAGDLEYQVGVKPNPMFGYTGNQLADEGTDQHQLYFSQQIVTGDKLALNRRVLSRARQAQLWDVESQRYRVLTDVRLRYYEALAAQQKMELTHDFAEVTRRGVELSELRKDALEGSQIEVLQSQIQLNEVELLRQQAEFEFESAWKDLVAIAGVPYLLPAPLEGELRPGTSEQDWDNLYSMLLGNSPELASAQNRVAEMAALVDRQKVQAIPNLTVELGAGVDNSTDSGMINLNVEAPLPLYNKNKGNISAAYADYCRATQNVERIRLTLKSRLARVAQQYNVARAGVLKYDNEILPKAQETLDLSQQAYDAGELNFLQILIVRKTYFESNLEAVKARRDLAQAQVMIDGLLLSGALDAPADFDRDDSLRSQSLDGE
ncbi:TolC family protein [Rubinisphaera brasiliensis]|uniref:Outer membrane efflux protein n=1 Tax=Rubinisphaera brasiliensis (strain ATCC 49424 / DSM 5305 / JCM 21570 / IAM 15109 / NBRC 103401 / IFAM 1448) TaxID=756272 RepID=F0SRE6_RUBBR|nr:TolC family protein [Rubinisphaera brasiliensis]ADY58007.1 outer membrane efflux protein [Rubinisphaera brasiliensis DSM 5305]